MLVSYVGLSHLSLNYSISSLVHGFKVQIIDEKETINDFIEKKLNFFEPNLNDYLNKYSDKIIFNSDFNNLNKSDLIFVALDVLTNDKDKVLYKRLNQLIKKTLLSIKRAKIPLIIMSQVEPGFTRKIKYESKYLYHYVETLIFGKAVQRALYPDRIIIGKAFIKNQTSLKLINYLKKFNCEIIEMSFEESELTKAFINIYLAAQVTTTNNLNNIANTLGANWTRIRKALILDKRIGSFSYTVPGLGLSGGNIERDVKTLNDLCKKNELRLDYFNLLKKDNLYFKNWLFRLIVTNKCLNKKIGILGITYKENTLSCKNSPSLELINKLKLKNLFLHDRRNKKIKIDNTIMKRFFDLKTVIDSSEVLIVMHQIDIYKKIKLKNSKIRLIFDPFNVFFQSKKKLLIKHLTLTN